MSGLLYNCTFGRMCIFETKKILRNKRILLLMILLLFFSFLNIIYQLFIPPNSVYNKRKIWNEVIYQEDVDDSYILFEVGEEIKQYVDEVQEYAFYRETTIQNATGMSVLDVFGNQSDDNKNKEVIKKMFERLESISPEPAFLFGISQYLNDNIFEFLLLCGILVIGVGVTKGDRDSAIEFLKTTKNGNSKLLYSKIIAAITLFTFFYLLNSCIRVTLEMTVTPYKALLQPIQSIPGYLESPLKISVLETMFYDYIMKWVSCITILMVVFLVSDVFEDVATSIVISGLVYLIQYECYITFEKNSFLAVLHFGNLIAGLKLKQFFSIFISFQIGNLVLYQYIIWLMFQAIFQTFLIILIIIRNRLTKRISCSFAFIRHRKIKKHGLVYYEWKKLMFSCKGFLFLPILFVILVSINVRESNYVDLQEYYYLDYAEKIQGKDYWMQKEWVRNQIDFQNNQVVSNNRFLETYSGDNNSHGEYVENLLLQNSIPYKIKALNHILSEMEELEERFEEEENRVFIAQTPWKHLLEFDSLFSKWECTGLLILWIIVPYCLLLRYEVKYSCRNTLFSNKKHTKEKTSRYICMLIYISIICIATFVMKVLFCYQPSMLSVGKNYTSFLLFLPQTRIKRRIWTEFFAIWGIRFISCLTVGSVLCSIINRCGKE